MIRGVKREEKLISEAMAALGRRNKGKTSEARKRASKANLELARQARAKKLAQKAA